eukprot:SAG11_NODE_24221_length_376_cov_1.407942_1_plen_44_part_10
MRTGTQVPVLRVLNFDYRTDLSVSHCTSWSRYIFRIQIPGKVKK